MEAMVAVGAIASSSELRRPFLVISARSRSQRVMSEGFTSQSSNWKTPLAALVSGKAPCGPLAEASVNVDMIVQNVSEDGKETDLTFTVTKSDFDRAIKVLEDNRLQLGYKSLRPDPGVVKVSVIGVGMRSHTGVALTMFRALAEKGINIQVISTSEIKVSVLINEQYLELALRALHTAYGLDTG